MPSEKLNPIDAVGCSVIMGAKVEEEARLIGRYTFECFDKDGNLKWTEVIDNTVVTVGKNLALDTFLAGSAYTVTGPFLGLISSTSFTAISAADTMTSHAGWLEAGGANTPTYTAPRKTAVFSAASGGSKALSAPLNFAITGTGTIKGGFMTYGTGAVSTIDSTTGTLLSAGLFVSGDRAVLSGDQINITWSLSM